MAKPMKTLELHYPMIQFLIIVYIHQDSYTHIKIPLYTARFVYIHQDLYIYIKIRAVRT